MIWQLTLGILVFAIIMLYQAIERISPISAIIAAFTWAYFALLAGSVQVVPQSGTPVDFGYRSLAIYGILLALGSVIVAIWAYGEEAQEAVSENRTGWSLDSGGR